MVQDPQDKNNLANQQAAEQHVKQLLGPPPHGNNQPAEVQSAPQTPTNPSLPLESTQSTVDEPPEKLLVIPAEDGSADTNATDSETKQPMAGETIIPTDLPITDKSDESLKTAEDIKSAKVQKNKKKNFFKKWWHNRTARRLTIIAAIVILVGLVALPTSRYFILNNIGVRSSVSLTVLDNSTQLPLKNVEVSLAGQTSKTDENGNARIEHIKLGRHQLGINKRAFATINQTIVVGWGSNPLGDFQIQPTGSQYSIFVKDWLTAKPVTEASANAGEADAIADKNGKILLTIDTTLAQHDSLPVTIQADHYRTETVELNLASKADTTANMVIDRKDVFISNRSGKYGVYAVDIDGKNEKLVLAGSGLEREDIVLVQHPTENQAALVSTRVNARNNDGFLMSTLTLIDLKDNTTQAISQSEQVQIIGWSNNRLVYVQIAAGASASDPQRFQLISYDFKTADKKTIASANEFNDVMLDGSDLYYAPSNAHQKSTSGGLIKSSVDGQVKKTILSDEVWNVFRVNYDTLNLATENDWYEYSLGTSDTPVKLSEDPASPKNRLYLTSSDHKQSLWVDQRDGKGLLIKYDVSSKTDTTLETKKGLIYPVKWLNNEVLIYRVSDDDQSADYVLNIAGGTSHKVTDLYNAKGIDRWYYY